MMVVKVAMMILITIMIRGDDDDTVSAFNSCTKLVGSPGIIQDRKPNCHTVTEAWMTS